MNDSAFKLGQLLAAADMVHAGYCPMSAAVQCRPRC